MKTGANASTPVSATAKGCPIDGPATETSSMTAAAAS